LYDTEQSQLQLQCSYLDPSGAATKNSLDALAKVTNRENQNNPPTNGKPHIAKRDNSP
jgi:hypothetical protein